MSVCPGPCEYGILQVHQEEQHKENYMNKLINRAAAVGFALTLGLTGCSVPPLQSAAEVCGTESGIMDGGDSLVVQVNEYDEGEHTISQLECVLGELDAPDSVVQHMAYTRLVDGQQEAEWGKHHARWAFSPGEEGLRVTFTTN